jgi:hypothetical protein
MKNKFLYLYTSNQRKGIFLLLLVIIFTQAIYYFWSSNTTSQKDKEDYQWLALQSYVDSLKQVKEEYKPTIYPFNPNFITDVKGYRLGMSVEELNRLEMKNDARNINCSHDIAQKNLIHLKKRFTFSPEEVDAEVDRITKNNNE